MICASSWLKSWNDDTTNSLLESTTSDSVQIYSSMSVLASCVSTNEKSSFYSTHLQVRFTAFLRIGVLPSPCGSSRIPISNPRRCCVQDFKFCSRVDVQNYISMVVIWAFIEIHNVQGYLWSGNLDALVGGTIWMVAAMSTTWTAALLLLLYWRGLLAYLCT